MSSGLAKYNEELEEQEAEKAREWLRKKAEEIANIDPYSCEYRYLKWIEKNKEKILRNTKLIDLIG